MSSASGVLANVPAWGQMIQTLQYPAHLGAGFLRDKSFKAGCRVLAKRLVASNSSS